MLFSRRVTDVGFIVTLLAFLSVAVGYAVKINHLQQRAVAIPVNKLALGSRVTPFSLRKVAGGTLPVLTPADTKPTVLYIFTPQCTYCAHNKPGIISLVSQRGSAYHFIGVSLTDKNLGPYLSTSHIGFEAVGYGPTLDTRRALHLAVTPELMLISPQGTLLFDARGAFDGQTKTEIERTFAVVLPSLPSLS